LYAAAASGLDVGGWGKSVIAVGAALVAVDEAGSAADDEAGDELAAALARLMRATAMPNGLLALGYNAADIPALVEGAFAQQRLLSNAPRNVAREDLAGLFAAAATCW